MSNLENTISHPRQCVGCNHRITVNDDSSYIDAIEYVCEIGPDGEFIAECKENTAYTTGYHEGDYPKSEGEKRREIVNAVKKYSSQKKLVDVYLKKSTGDKKNSYAGVIRTYNLSKGVFQLNNFGKDYPFSISDIEKIELDSSYSALYN